MGNSTRFLKDSDLTFFFSLKRRKERIKDFLRNKCRGSKGDGCVYTILTNMCAQKPQHKYHSHWVTLPSPAGLSPPCTTPFAAHSPGSPPFGLAGDKAHTCLTDRVPLWQLS